MAKRGTIIRVSRDGSVLMAVDGKQYAFLLEGKWESKAAPEVGMPVDVTFNQDGAPETVEPANATQSASQARPVSPKLS